MSWIQSAFGTKISPIILFVIVVLAVVFFIAALVHLLIRFLLKLSRYTNPNSFPDFSASRTFQRQLQHLFHLHDSGLDQALIDTLPVFLYKDVIMGSNFEPFDCAVCLCEFCEDDNLRLLPLCSHAFHIDCIDTWLLSNSSCPLCRGVILSHDNPCFYFNENEYGISRNDEESAVINEKRVFSVRLGKFKNTIDVSNSESSVGAVGESSNSNLDARRCYSMGSFQYVVADSELQVALCHSGRDKVLLGKGRGGQNGTFTCDVDEGKKIKVGESFSVSKIWLWSKKSKLHTSTSSRGIQFSTNSVNESYN